MTDKSERVDSLLSEADALIEVKRFEAAAERARDAAVLDPLNHHSFGEWSRALYGLGRYAEAAEMADEAIRLAPESALNFRLRARALSSLARTCSGADRSRLGSEAAASAREAVRLAPWDPNGHIELAQALPLAGAIREADEAVQQAIRLAPNSASTWVAASLVALGAKNWKAAISASRRALAIEPDNYAALNNLGVALRASGNSREGTQALARAAQINPESLAARRNLSRAGINIARVVVLVLLFPVVFVTHVGFTLYLVVAVASNVGISRNPKLVLRLERWMSPLALFFVRKRNEPSGSGGDSGRPRPHSSAPTSDPVDQPWSAIHGHYVIGTSVVIFGAVVSWSIALIFLIGLVVPGSGKPALAISLLVCAGIATWPTIVILRRRRSERGPGYPPRQRTRTHRSRR